MKKRLIAIFTAVVIVALILAASFQYVQFVSDTIYSESVAHLREIYHQANQSLYSLVGRNWSLLRMWAPYLRDIHEVAKVRQYVETLLHQIAREVRDGNIDADPCCRSEDDSFCKYCDWADACHFQDGRDGDHLHYILPVKAEEFWMQLEETEGGGD